MEIKAASRILCQRGFTLLETLIAITILMIALSSILVVESGSIDSTAKARELNIAAMLAKNLMVDSEFLMEGKAFTELKKEETGIYPEPFQDYTWKREVKEIKFPQLDIAKLASAANGGGAAAKDGAAPQQDDTQNQQMLEMFAKLMAKYVSKSIREVTITISWQRGKGTQSYDVTTYWVDLTQGFDLDG